MNVPISRHLIAIIVLGHTGCGSPSQVSDADLDTPAPDGDMDVRFDDGDIDVGADDGDVDGESADPDAEGSIHDADGTHGDDPMGPVIFYTDIIGGPGTGGEDNSGAYLTLVGARFGAQKGQSTVTVGGGEVGRYVSWADKKVSVQLGPAAADGDIRISTDRGPAVAPEPFDVREGELVFVSPEGSDTTGDGSFALPFRTPNHALSLAALDSGDFVVLRGGLYDLSSGEENLQSRRWINVPDTSGASPSEAITIYGYPGETPTLDWADLDVSPAQSNAIRGIFFPYAVSNWAVSNITFNQRDSGGAVIYVGFYSDPDSGCTNLRMTDMTIRGGMGQDVQTVNTVSLQRAEGLKLYGLDVGQQSPAADPDLQSHIVYMSHFYTDAEIAWSHIHDNPYGRAALQIAGDPWNGRDSWGANTNVRIHHNRFDNLPEAAVLVGWGASEIFLYENVIHNACTREPPGFSPLALRGSRNDHVPGGRYYIYNNTVHSDATDSNPGGIVQIAYSPASSLPEEVSLYNNIFSAMSPSSNYYQINHVDFSTDRIHADFNLWHGSSEPLPDWSGEHAVDGAPGFVAPGTDFHLNEGSPCLGQGTASGDEDHPVANVVDLDFDGRPLDEGTFHIGAFGAGYQSPGTSR